MAIAREETLPIPQRLSAALFLLAATALVALRLWLAARAPRLYEFEQYWEPIARAQNEGRPLWRVTDYHFFPAWAWLLGFFEAAARKGGSFATIERSFLAFVDVAIAGLVYRLAGRVPGAVSPRAAALLYLANPVGIWVSSVQGQFDGLALAFLLAALLFPSAQSRSGRSPWAGVLLGLSIAAKQVTLFHPLLWLRRRRDVSTVAIAYVLPVLTLLPYAADWRVIARSLLVYSSVPRSYGFSELVLYDSRFAPFVSAACLAAALASIVWLRRVEPARSCLVLFLVLLLFAPGMGSQYLLWPIPFGALFGGAPYLIFSAASMLWILGSHFGLPGSGRWMGQLIWLSVGWWTYAEIRVLRAGRRSCPA
jgi:hypothetical protein